jgi:hypothetical protein
MDNVSPRANDLYMTAGKIILGFIFGAIGLWMIREAKRRVNFNSLFIGIALVVYTYFTPNAWWDLGIGIVLCLIAYKTWN